MVTAVTTFGRSGLSDWVLQRFTALLLAAYTLFIVGFLLANPDLTYEQWSELYSCVAMRIFSFIVLLMIVIHGWIGLWVVLTDYVTTRLMGSPATAIRIIVLTIYAVLNMVFLVWGAEILWGL